MSLTHAVNSAYCFRGLARNKAARCQLPIQSPRANRYGRSVSNCISALHIAYFKRESSASRVRDPVKSTSQRNPHSSLSICATPHGRLSKIETAESEEATRRSRPLARRPTFTAFKEVQVDQGTSLCVQFSASILGLPFEGVAHSSSLERTRSTEST
jgi:hypothetical protein